MAIIEVLILLFGYKDRSTLLFLALYSLLPQLPLTKQTLRTRHSENKYWMARRPCFSGAVSIFGSVSPAEAVPDIVTDFKCAVKVGGVTGLSAKTLFAGNLS